jgi:hypothetical protein
MDCIACGARMGFTARAFRRLPQRGREEQHQRARRVDRGMRRQGGGHGILARLAAAVEEDPRARSVSDAARVLHCLDRPRPTCRQSGTVMISGRTGGNIMQLTLVITFCGGSAPGPCLRFRTVGVPDARARTGGMKLVERSTSARRRVAIPILDGNQIIDYIPLSIGPEWR